MENRTKPIHSELSRHVAGLLLPLLLAWAGPTALAQNAIDNPGFETGDTSGGWSTLGGSSDTAQSIEVHSGSWAVLVAGRSGTWDGIQQSLLSDLTVASNSVMMTVSAWVKLNSGGSDSARLTMRWNDQSGNGTRYSWVATGTATDSGWTQLTGTWAVDPVGNLTELTLYLEGPAATIDYYADDFSVEITEVSGDWKAEANARIEQIRKRDVLITVVDPLGNPFPGVDVQIEQTMHRFGFGSAINNANNNMSNPQYTGFFKNNFEWAVMENESKWYYNEPVEGYITYADADIITNFCHANDITLRGHTIFWAVSNAVQGWVQDLSDDELRVALTNRLDGGVSHFQDTFVHWDVNNELLHGNYFGERLGDDINIWMFQRARLLDPDVKLFVNDFNVVSQAETEAYKQQILSLIASNAPIDGIGVQGHFGSTVNPLLTEVRLDSLAELQLPIWITEYDSSNADVSARADNLETLYRIAFSKPEVEGILMWGFWENAHWRENGHIVDSDWTLNEAGLRYQALLQEWTTVTNGISDGTGQVGFRGFHGEYDLILTAPGQSPTLRRMILDPGEGTNEVVVVVSASGAYPLLHGENLDTGSFRFWLTDEAGNTLAIQSTTNLVAGDWTTVTNLPNPEGTVGFTNPVSENQEFFRAVAP